MYLGYIILDKGIEMDPKKVQAINKWPTPKNISDVLFSLEFTNLHIDLLRDTLRLP